MFHTGSKVGCYQIYQLSFSDVVMFSIIIPTWNDMNKANEVDMLLVVFLLGTVGLFALMDRLVMGAFQRRSGPYSIGWFGLLQPIVDGIKLIKKESIIVQK